MNKIFQSALVAILSIYSTHVFAEGTTINYRLATADETRKLMQSNTEYYAKMNQMDIDWRVRKEGSTLAELQTMAWQQNFYPQKFGTFELILYICGVILITTSKY